MEKLTWFCAIMYILCLLLLGISAGFQSEAFKNHLPLAITVAVAVFIRR